MKKCTKCKVEKPLLSFWKNKNKKDGHAFACKDCETLARRDLYYRDHDSFLSLAKKYYRKNKKRLIRLQEERKKRYPEKFAARQVLQEAVRCGKIKKLPCEVCGDKKTDGHHTDYSKALDVRWLCRTHHAEIHRKYQRNNLPKI